jgi:mRNA-degrading endonuclease toxin of MazEF toxin-antitoxin module
MAARPAFAYGQIVIVERLLDPQGRNPKDRACVVVTPTDRIVPGALLDVVAITTKVPESLPSDHVRLPWHPAGHPRTGLNKRNAAVCSWLDAVEQGRAVRRIGVVPGDRLALIAASLAELDRGGE